MCVLLRIADVQNPLVERFKTDGMQEHVESIHERGLEAFGMATYVLFISEKRKNDILPPGNSGYVEVLRCRGSQMAHVCAGKTFRKNPHV